MALGFLALSACGWVIYRLGSAWFGRAAGALAALIFLTRVPVLAYGVRAYVDLPYLRSCWRRCCWSRTGAVRARGHPCCAAGAGRPAASRGVGLLGPVLAVPVAPPFSAARPGKRRASRGARRAPAPGALAAAAPLIWVLSDLPSPASRCGR